MSDLHKLTVPIEIYTPFQIAPFRFSLKETVRLSKLHLFFITAIEEHHATVNELLDATMLSPDVLQYELQTMCDQKLILENEDEKYQITELSRSLLNYQRLIEKMNSSQKSFLFDLTTGKVSFEQEESMTDMPNVLKSKASVSKFNFSMLTATDIKAELCHAFACIEELDDKEAEAFLDNIIMDVETTNHRLWKKKYITHLPVDLSASNPSDLKVNFYVYQMCYRPYDPKMEEVEHIIESLKTIEAYDSSLLDTKVASLLERWNLYKTEKEKEISFWINPVDCSVHEGKVIEQPSINPWLDLFQYDFSIDHEAIAQEALKQFYTNISQFPFKIIQNQKIAVCLKVPVSCIHETNGDDEQ